MFFWLCANGCYFIFVLILSEVGNQLVVNDGSFDVLTGFACYLAGIVIFRVFFAFLYIIKWQIRYSCDKKYFIPEVNLEKVFKEVKKKASKGDDSTDDEELIEKT